MPPWLKACFGPRYEHLQGSHRRFFSCFYIWINPLQHWIFAFTLSLSTDLVCLQHWSTFQALDADITFQFFDHAGYIGVEVSCHLGLHASRCLLPFTALTNTTLPTVTIASHLPPPWLTLSSSPHQEPSVWPVWVHRILASHPRTPCSWGQTHHSPSVCTRYACFHQYCAHEYPSLSLSLFLWLFYCLLQMCNPLSPFVDFSAKSTSFLLHCF